MYMSDICGYSDVVYFDFKIVNHCRTLKGFIVTRFKVLKTCHVPFSVISAYFA